jgi:hypothetical protein
MQWIEVKSVYLPSLLIEDLSMDRISNIPGNVIIPLPSPPPFSQLISPRQFFVSSQIAESKC